MVPIQIIAQDGVNQTIDTAVDTGFTGTLTLPVTLVEALGLRFWEVCDYILADGTTATLDTYIAQVDWDEQDLEVAVVACAGDALLGMGLLNGHRLTIDCLVGGAVTIEALGHVHEAN